MKLAKKQKAKDEKAEALKTNPRIIREVGLWQTFAKMIEDEAIQPVWRWELYRLHRRGFLTGEQREAGDRYHTLHDDMRRFVWEGEEPTCELDQKRLKTLKERYSNALALLGMGRGCVDSLVLENCYLYPAQQHIARDGLQLLANFFGLSKNKSRT